jgi:tripartite-type tricarboxylate transporter receptor subunit TctC
MDRMYKLIFLGLALLFPFDPEAPTYPEKPITIVHDFEAGGGADI